MLLRIALSSFWRNVNNMDLSTGQFVIDVIRNPGQDRQLVLVNEGVS